jgi:hypothetical protein
LFDVRGVVDGIDKQIRYRLIFRVHGHERTAVSHVSRKFSGRTRAVVGNAIHPKEEERLACARSMSIER